MTTPLDAARRKVPAVPRWHNEWLTIVRLAGDVAQLSSDLEGTRLLDIGCGNKPYRTLFGIPSYIGIDITHASSEADVIASAHHMPFAPEVFDCALCIQVLEHVRRPGLLLSEALRVLKPDGQLMLSAPMYWRHHEEPSDFYRYTRHGLKYLVENAGFEVECLIQQGGAWRLVGQCLANTLHASIAFRTLGLKAAALIFINTLFSWLDRLNYHPEDTLNFVVLARKP